MNYSASDELGNQPLTASDNGAVVQARSPIPKLTPAGWGLVAGGTVVLVGGLWGIWQLTHAPQMVEPERVAAIAVETLTVRPQPMANTVELSGTIRPIDQATLSTRVMGRITRLRLEAGDRVRQGEVLARIDVVDMAAQTSQALSGVAQAQAEVARSQASLNQLQSQKLEAEAALQLAQINQTRMAQLQKEGAVPLSQLDAANTALDQAKARVAQSQAGIEQSQAAIAQSRAAVAQARSSVTSAAVNQSYGTILAPFDGVVVQKLAYEGEMAAPGTALLKLENPNRLQLEIPVPETNLRFVRAGQPIQVRVEAVNQTLNATIGQIVPTTDPNSRSFLIKIPLPQSGRLISGMFGRISLPQDSHQPMIAVPTTALLQRGQLQGVYVVDSSVQPPLAVLRWVKTGKTQNDHVEIVSGLMAGDRIITSHLPQLTDGQAVAPTP